MTTGPQATRFSFLICAYEETEYIRLVIQANQSSLNSNRKIRERKGKERSIFIYDIPRLPDLPTSF
jgi:hypothetical protein